MANFGSLPRSIKLNGYKSQNSQHLGLKSKKSLSEFKVSKFNFDSNFSSRVIFKIS